MKLLTIAALSLTAYATGLKLGQIEYECRPYKPAEECEVGLYEISFYEQQGDPEPLAIADSHCVRSLTGRLEADTVRLVTYSMGEIKEVEFHEVLEFPTRNTEVCKVE
jgi:hypothetical protein